jgi:L(+)-tartrate dehydratase beta subunit
MKENTARACKDFGAIHCVFPAGNAVVAAVEVKEIVEAQWKDLGMPETLWHCHVEEFGPLIVSIDSYGKNYFEEKKVEYNKKKDQQVELISQQVGFIKLLSPLSIVPESGPQAAFGYALCFPSCPLPGQMVEYRKVKGGSRHEYTQPPHRPHRSGHAAQRSGGHDGRVLLRRPRRGVRHGPDR